MKGINSLPNTALAFRDLARVVLQVPSKSRNIQRCVRKGALTLYTSRRRACQLESVTNNTWLMFVYLFLIDGFVRTINQPWCEHRNAVMVVVVVDGQVNHDNHDHLSSVNINLGTKQVPCFLAATFNNLCMRLKGRSKYTSALTQEGLPTQTGDQQHMFV